MICQEFYQYFIRPLLLTSYLLVVVCGYSQEKTEQTEEQNLTQSIRAGAFIFDARLRYWYAKQDDLRASNAYTFGTNFGYLTKSYKGFQVYLEGESVVAINPNIFFDGVNDQTDRTVVTDVETLELNKARVSYSDTLNETILEIKVGRQAAIVEDERFIGNVTARQDDQTFDAAMLKVLNDQKGISFEYAYMYKINRLLAEVGDWRSDSHAFRLGFSKNNMVRVGLFAHLLDFQEDAPGKSNQTYGITLDRAELPQDRTALTYKVALAYQTEYGDNPIAYDAYLINAEMGISLPKIGTFNIGYELATSDDGVASYQFPLSTGQRLHRISDVFIDPPADGLHNPYVTAEFQQIIWGIGGWLGYHVYFSEEESTQLAQEIDVVLYRPLIPGLLRAELTYSSFFAEEIRYSDLGIFALDIVVEL